ncbi:chaperone NapD [Aliamphritea spongicola]|nr:chaperone NapD [Aliamphritea spongicola]
MQQVQETIFSIPGTEIPNSTPEGKLVVVLEADDQAQLLDRIDHIQGADHILSASLVYHHIA